MQSDIEQIKSFTDQEIGLNYYSKTELKTLQNQSVDRDINCSFVLEKQGKIFGLRLSFPPGCWEKGKGDGLTPVQWPHPIDKTGYFQSLFICKNLQRKGYGRELSEKSIEAMKKLDALGVVCHSWKESPGNASMGYLEKMGFISICDHKEYWKQVDYVCTRCGSPCLCTACEMYLDIS